MTMEPRTWDEVLPNRLVWELAQMKRVAPELSWSDSDKEWSGLAPVWPFDRPRPPKLCAFLNGDRFKLKIVPSPAHPAVPPKIWPVEPRTEFVHRSDTAWHTIGDGSLCVVREYYTWTGVEACAALVPTAAGWFLEFLLRTAGVINAMTAHGIETSAELDDLFVPSNRRSYG